MMMTPSKPPVAGKGSNVDAKKPIYKNASGYMPEEDVNQGPHGGKKGKVSAGHGQISDDMAAKNKLVGQSDYQKDPYRAEGKDFPVKNVSAFTGQSGSVGTVSGKNELARYSVNLEGPRHLEDSGPMTPVPGDRGARVAASFSVGVNQGEGEGDTGEIGISEMIDLQTGHIVGGSGGAVQYVPQNNVTVGAPPSRNPKAGLVSRN
jgi:hypothetical protein